MNWKVPIIAFVFRTCAWFAITRMRNVHKPHLPRPSPPFPSGPGEPVLSSAYSNHAGQMNRTLGVKLMARYGSPGMSMPLIPVIIYVIAAINHDSFSSRSPFHSPEVNKMKKHLSWRLSDGRKHTDHLLLERFHISLIMLRHAHFFRAAKHTRSKVLYICPLPHTRCLDCLMLSSHPESKTSIALPATNIWTCNLWLVIYTVVPLGSQQHTYH